MCASVCVVLFTSNNGREQYLSSPLAYKNDMNGHLFKRRHLSLCGKEGRQGVILAERKKMSHVIFNESTCGICQERWLAPSAHCYLPSVPRLRGSGGPPKPSCGTNALEAIKERKQHLANRRTQGRGNGGRKKQKATQEMEQRAAHYHSEQVLQAMSVPLVPQRSVGVTGKSVAGKINSG